VWLQTRCELVFVIAVPTPLVLMLRPRSGAQQWVASEQYWLSPGVPVFEFTDGYGNLCQRLVAPEGAFSIHTAAQSLL
jgi:Bacterial transglutaminase-like N-terminal region